MRSPGCFRCLALALLVSLAGAGGAPAISGWGLAVAAPDGSTRFFGPWETREACVAARLREIAADRWVVISACEPV